MRKFVIYIIGKKDGITIENLFITIKKSYPKLNTSNLRIREIKEV